MLVGKERFSENHAWSEMPQHWPALPCRPSPTPPMGHCSPTRMLWRPPNASLTSDYFAAASRRLGEALAAYLNCEPPAGLRRTP